MLGATQHPFGTGRSPIHNGVIRLNIQHLPLENPTTYKRVRDLLVGALVPALTEVLEPLWVTLTPLQPKDAKEQRRNHDDDDLQQRRYALTRLLLEHRERVLYIVFERLQPVKNKGVINTLERDNRGWAQQRDLADTTWELVVWLLDGLLQKQFHGRKVSAEQFEDAPFFLGQLARKLAGLPQWEASHVARCLQGVFSELSAEHTCERLHYYYGQGGDFSVNRIMKVLRPVDVHQNRALGILANPADLEAVAALILGTVHSNEAFRVRQVVRHKVPMPVHWLMNWTDELTTIQTMVAAVLTKSIPRSEHETRSFRVQKAGAETAGNDIAGLKPLSNNKELYVRKKGAKEISFDATVAKLGGALQQLFDLHHMGHMGNNSVDLGEVLDRLSEEGVSGHDEEGEAESLEQAYEPGAMVSAASHFLGPVFDCLDDKNDDLVRAAVLVRLCARLPDRKTRESLQAELKLYWEEQGVFQRLGIALPRYDKLTDQCLALARGLPLKVFQERVEAWLQQFDITAALTSETAEHPTGISLRLTHPILRVGVALRFLQRLPSPADRERWAQALWETWSDKGRFDGGLFDYLGVDVSDVLRPNLPDSDRPWAEKALLNKLTDGVLAFGMDIGEDSFRAQVEQALAQFEAAHSNNPRLRLKAAKAQAGAKQ